jgi:hypothetical protein
MGRRARRAEERAKWIARLARALLWAAVLIAAVVGILALIGVTAGNIAAAAIGLTLACLVWLPVTRRWNARAYVWPAGRARAPLPQAGGTTSSRQVTARPRKRSRSAASLSRRAAALARDAPTYYGNAWAALGPALLERSIDPCASA